MKKLLRPSAILLMLTMLLTGCGGGSGGESSGASSKKTSGTSGVSETSADTESSDDTGEIPSGAYADSSGNIIDESTGSIIGRVSSSANPTSSRQRTRSEASSASSTTPGKSSVTSSASSTTTPLTPIGNPLPVTSTLLCYMSTDISKTHLLPSVAYMENDVIKDTMYDTFLFLPSQTIIASSNKKQSWDRYFTDSQFAGGINLDSLEQAVEETKAALGKNFKVNVILSVWNPDRYVTSFGEVNGKNLDLSKLDDRKTAIKYFVDEQVKRFKAKNFRNLNLAGFYWFHESIAAGDSQTKDVIKTFTDHVRGAGYFSCWIPYNGAAGYDTAKNECGFDKVNMQANYFPASGSGSNNYAFPSWAPFKETLDKVFTTWVKQRTVDIGNGLEMELSGNAQKSYTGFKLYMLYAMKLGLDKNPNYQAYYMNSGPGSVREMYRSKDAYTQSTYGQLYKFIKRTLKESDITLIPADAATKTADLW